MVGRWIAKLELFKRVRIYAGGDNGFRTESVPSGKYKQTGGTNPSFCRPTNPQVSGFWIFLPVIGDERLIWTVHTFEEKLFSFWCGIFFCYCNKNIFVCECKKGEVLISWFPDIAVLWVLYGHTVPLLSVRPLFLCPAIKGGKAGKTFSLFAFTPKLCLHSRHW